MNILITGITGYIGKNLSKKLVEREHKVCGIVRKESDRDMLSQEGISCYLDNDKCACLRDFSIANDIDGVIHLATNFKTEHRPEDVEGILESNICFPWRVLEATIAGGVGWFINTGTFSQSFNGCQGDPSNLYAATKQAFESLAQYYIGRGEIDFVTLRIQAVYGPGDTRRKIFNTWKDSLKNRDKVYMSPGEQLVDFIHIDDVCEAYITMMSLMKKDNLHRKHNGKHYDISSGKFITLKDVADLFMKACGREMNIWWGTRPYRWGEIMQQPNPIIPVPGWEPTKKFEDGVGEILRDLEEHCGI